MPSFLTPVILPLIVGPLTFVVMQLLKQLSAVVDNLPPMVKRFAVAGIATLMTLLGTAVGVDLSCNPELSATCLEVLDKDAVRALLSAGVAYVLHFAKNAAKKKDV
jgi:hypothetical protein